MRKTRLQAYDPLDHAWLVDQHQQLYARDEGFDQSFAPLVSDILDQFETYDGPHPQAGWIAWQGEQRLGSIFCTSRDAHCAKLRLFLTADSARGTGLGATLLEHCMGFARAAGYRRMVLWTHESHRAACALYARTGWICTKSTDVVSFGVPLVEQQWEITL